MDNVKPNYIACLLDVSGHCSDDFLEKCGGKLFLSGFFDDSVNTHCCSFTPMVDVTYLDYVPEALPEGEEAREALRDELMEVLNGEEQGGYYLRREIESTRQEHPDRFVAVESTFDEDATDRERDEEIREYLSGNPVHG